MKTKRIDYNAAVTLPEPENGSIIVVQFGDLDQPELSFRVIWRDDEDAAAHGTQNTHPDDRWFDAHGEDGMSWGAHLRYAHVVYELHPAYSRIVTRSPAPEEFPDAR